VHQGPAGGGTEQLTDEEADALTFSPGAVKRRDGVERTYDRRAATVTGKVGPNAIIQLADVLADRLGVNERAAALRAAGLDVSGVRSGADDRRARGGGIAQGGAGPPAR
jgi:hypothetical protein